MAEPQQRYSASSEAEHWQEVAAVDGFVSAVGAFAHHSGSDIESADDGFAGATLYDDSFENGVVATARA